MPDRFYHPPPLALGSVQLEGSEAHHLMHVLRATPGLLVTLFDGSGAEFPSRVESIQRATVTLTALERLEIDRELPSAVTLGVALPKGDRQRWLVEKLVELGATRLVPLITARGVAQPAGEAITRLERAVIEASKQCGRNRLMEIRQTIKWTDFLKSTQAAQRVRCSLRRNSARASRRAVRVDQMVPPS